ncbi:MAG: AAA domain-containing protein [Candidatus Hermodarchaeota archaeon]
MRKSNFTKTLLQSYIITNCKRRLFLELGRNKPELWFDPLRAVPSKPPERRFPPEREYLVEKGKEYEQLLYLYLKKLDNAIFEQDNQEQVIPSTLSEEQLLKFYDLSFKEKIHTLMLLEFQYSIPPSFFKTLFSAKSSVKELPVDYTELRPDIMFIGNELNDYIEEVFEVCYDGKIRIISKDELATRIGISIFDIKYTPDEHVSKKHFLEIFYYLITLALYLKEHKLENKYYVRANFNGIFPLHRGKELDQIRSIKDIFILNLANIISWKEANRIFTQVMNVIKQLWKNAPCPIENITTNIHQGCGYCQYIEDCKITLGMEDQSNPREWSSRLLPFTSQSIAQQLIEEYNCPTLGDILNNIDQISVGSIPKPLYSELPTLKMKAEALVNDRIIYPNVGQTHSYAIPRYSPIAVNFDVEYDRNNDKIFAIGIYLKMFISSKLSYHGIFDNWWQVWRTALETNKDNAEIQNELKQFLIRDDIALETVAHFRDCLSKLKKVQIHLRGEKSKAGTIIEYHFASINRDITPESEARLIINAIYRLNLVLELCNILEDYITTDAYQSGMFFGPDTTIYYWSRTQLEHFQDMMERHLMSIINNEKAREAYEALLIYFTPSDTEVNHPYQHKKLFDVQAFVDSFIGFPDIINYTWHGIAKKLFNYTTNLKFWIPHFNFLDLTNWLKYLSESDIKEKEKVEQEIKRQVMIKLLTVNRIREYFQREGNFILSENARVISRFEYTEVILPNSYHDIAHVWYLFSKLNSALQQLDDEYYRTIFPQFSIGKLFCARVRNLQLHDTPSNKIYYTFDTIQLSSNIKVKEGDSVLLVPNDKRGMKFDGRIYKWVFYIEEIVWDPTLNGNRISTKITYNDVFEQCRKENIDPETQNWYLYPLSSDSWSSKLHDLNNNGLLERKSFGQSWLGFRLAYLWNIRTDPRLLWPSNWEFPIHTLYLFAPEILSFFNSLDVYPTLMTQISPTPDPSQKEAIINSLQHVISGILGPPGTGKSQTIAALIDEFVIQSNKQMRNAKILVTSFSYAALSVVIDKIREGRGKNNRPTPSSQLQMIFLHSETQEPIAPKSGCRNVDDLLRNGRTWKLNGQSRTVTQTKRLEESLEESFIMFANAHQLFYLIERVNDNFAFDLICVDEASQLPVDYFMSSLQYIRDFKIRLKKPDNALPNVKVESKSQLSSLEIDKESLKWNPEDLTRIVIVGDHNQLPPVRIKNPPKNLEFILDSLFKYYIEGHMISNKQLKVNYRSHQDIVVFTSLLGLYKGLSAYKVNAINLLEGDLNRVNNQWVKQVLMPERVVCSLIHNRKFEIGISIFEAELVAEIVSEFYNMIRPQNRDQERKFWKERVGVVAPHNAQGRTIIRKIFEKFKTKSHFSETRLMEFLKSTIYSVEKFQGSDRDLIITSIGLSDEDKINVEEEFIFDLNRFNVLTSRAKNKVIFISSRNFLEYIPEDRTVMENASKFYLYVEEFCNKEIDLELINEHNNKEHIKFKFKQ